MIFSKDQVSQLKHIFITLLNRNKNVLPHFLVISFNQRKFCPNVTWNPNAITFANISTVGSTPFSLFINRNNTIYVANREKGLIQIWQNSSVNPTKTINGSWLNVYSFFVTTNEEIYVYNYNAGYRIDKWTKNENTSISVLSVGSDCYGLFVDINDNLYCSMRDLHQVVAKYLNTDVNTFTVVAGTGYEGSTSHTLKYPRGIFVDTNLDLYVADANNNRIQLFRRGESNATTVVGTGSSTISLYVPSGIILDADKYLYITDAYNSRIVGQGPNGFRCLVGDNGYGSASNQLSFPRSLSFDIYGNLFVADESNHRIQKFVLSSNFCGKNR